MSKLGILNEIWSDFKSVSRNPRAAFTEILTGAKLRYSKAHLLFILFMHGYFIFLPSYLVMFNILAILIFFILIGLMYYFVQECFFSYREHQVDAEKLDDRFFYTIAYCFALANIPAFILNVLTNVLCIAFNSNLIVGIFYATLLNLPIALIGLIYPVKLMALITQRENNLSILIEFTIRSFTTTCTEALGLRAIQEIWVDYREAPKSLL